MPACCERPRLWALDYLTPLTLYLRGWPSQSELTLLKFCFSWYTCFLNSLHYFTFFRFSSSWYSEEEHEDAKQYCKWLSDLMKDLSAFILLIFTYCLSNERICRYNVNVKKLSHEHFAVLNSMVSPGILFMSIYKECRHRKTH